MVAPTGDDELAIYPEAHAVIGLRAEGESSGDQSAPIALIAGRKYDIQLEYYENTGSSVIKLRWAYPGQVEQLGGL